MNKLLILLLLFTFKSYAKEIVYVVDTEINFNGTLFDYKCPTGHFSAVPNMVGDSTVHGTKMAKVIVKGLSREKICLVNIKVFNLRQDGKSALNSIIKGLTYLRTQAPGIINMSLNGPEPSLLEKRLLRLLLAKGFKLSLAAGNEGFDLSKRCDAYPACYFKGKHPLVRVSSNMSSKSNKNGPVTHYDNMKGGTSFSTANTTNKWIRHAK